MGRKKTRRRERLRRIAAGLTAAAAAIVPGLATAAGHPLHDAIEAEARTTTPARLLELAGTHPEQVLSNRVLRRLRTEQPEAHRDIVLAARFARAELALDQAMAGMDEATLRLFACDCAARVAPLYERFAGPADLLAEARARAGAAVATAAAAPEPAAASAPPGAYDLAMARAERQVDAFERQVASEAAVAGSATGALRRLVFTRGAEQVSWLEAGGRSGPPLAAPPFRMLAAAMPAAEAIDEAVLLAAGGSLRRIGAMGEAIAEAVYLDHVFRMGEPALAVEAVFRELAWQRSHLRALRSRGPGPAVG
jgi:hypothetical protein